MKSKILTIFIITLFLSLFLLLSWNSFNAPFERDEGEYAYSAYLMRTNGTPYQDSFLQKPPLIIYTYLAGQLISPLKVWPPRAIALMFTLITAFLIYLIAKKEWGNIAGVFSLFLFLPLINFPPITPFAANTEKFMILPITALLFLFVYYKDTNKIWPYLLAGIFSTLAIFYKPISLPVIFFIIIFWMFHLYRSQTPIKISTIVKPFSLIVGSSLFTTFILLIPFLKILPIFSQEVITFNLSYASAFENPLGNFFNYIGKFFHYWWVLLFLLIGLFLQKIKNIHYYFILLIISLFTVFSTPIGHYYLILMPFLALCCGALFNSFLETFANNDKQKIITTAIFLPTIILILIVPFKEQFSLSPQKLSEWVYGTVNPFGEAEEVATHLKEITNIDDYVFVAGSEPQIYYHAERKSPTRFVITYPLNLPTPFREEYQKELISDLEKNPPKAIVVSERVMSGLWNEGSPEIFIKYFNDLISKNYNIIGGYVWETNKKGHWQEPLNENDSLTKASLVLLIRK